jgi:hypothetical protein
MMQMMQWQQIKQQELKESNMDFIRAIQNDGDIFTDEEANKLLEELEAADPPRYTAAEWAAIEGGHSVEDLDESNAMNRVTKRVDGRNIMYYRLIIGASNLMRARLFLKLAREGKNIPAPYVQGMQPAIEMLDDIVTAGPGFVQLLKVLHKRAQNQQ